MDFFGMQVPISDEMKRQIDQHMMAQESLIHDIKRFFEEVPQEHLVTLGYLLRRIGDDDTGKLCSYFEGVITQTLALKYDVCGGCGQSHDEQIPVQEEQLFEMPDEVDLASEPSDIEPPEVEPDWAVEATAGNMQLTKQDIQNMGEYHLDDLRDSETNELLGFICTGCGLQYVSIEDRMLRPADSCQGCFLKSAHG